MPGRPSSSRSSSCLLMIFVASIDLNFGSGFSSARSTVVARHRLGYFFGRFVPYFERCLVAAVDARRVERAAQDVVAHAGQVADATAADEHDRVLLQVVALARDVGRDLLAVREAHARDLAQGRVGLLRRLGLDLQADAALLRAGCRARATWRAVAACRRPLRTSWLIVGIRFSGPPYGRGRVEDSRAIPPVNGVRREASPPRHPATRSRLAAPPGRSALRARGPCGALAGGSSRRRRAAIPRRRRSGSPAAAARCRSEPVAKRGLAAAGEQGLHLGVEAAASRRWPISPKSMFFFTRVR